MSTSDTVICHCTLNYFSFCVLPWFLSVYLHFSFNLPSTLGNTNTHAHLFSCSPSPGDRKCCQRKSCMFMCAPFFLFSCAPKTAPFKSLGIESGIIHNTLTKPQLSCATLQMQRDTRSHTHTHTDKLVLNQSLQMYKWKRENEVCRNIDSWVKCDDGQNYNSRKFYRITILDRWSIKLMLVNWKVEGGMEEVEGGLSHISIRSVLPYHKKYYESCHSLAIVFMHERVSVTRHV